jgi:hypothetical protein
MSGIKNRLDIIAKRWRPHARDITQEFVRAASATLTQAQLHATRFGLFDFDAVAIGCQVRDAMNTSSRAYFADAARALQHKNPDAMTDAELLLIAVFGDDAPRESRAIEHDAEAYNE